MPVIAVLRRSVPALLCVLALGCNSGKKTVGPASSSANYSVAVTPSSASTTLGTAVSFTATVSSSGFSGPVTLSATGLPASWQAAFSPSATINVTSGGNASATVTVTIPSNGAAATTGATVTIHGTASIGDRDGTTTLTVPNQYIVHLADGTGAGAHWGALSGTILNLNAGTTLTVENDDSVDHEVHTTASIPGFPHENGPLGTGGTYSGVVGAGQDSISCHIHGETATGYIRVHVQ
jgi:hypothetical protein